jgi:pSer/pThr/pTyr-binding forkhead associated (FHA) protein
VYTDLGSTNGSSVNGRPISGPEVLKPGDEVSLGGYSITFELD